MADFAKRPEVTVSTMGKVRNPTGEGVRAISTQVKAKAAANNENKTEAKVDTHETVVKEGTAKRNITRKKTDDKASGNYNSLHKKQGGHGKGQWRDEMDPSYVDEIPIDEKDPIYDETEDTDKYVLSSSVGPIFDADKRGYDPGTSKAVYGPMLTLSEFKVQLAECIKEYFDSCDADEVIRSLDELGCVEYHAEIVKKAISLSLDKGPRERELISRLLTCLHPTPLSLEEMEAGFNILLDGLDELSKDVPDAKTMAASFLARAVVDEVLPPAYMSDINNERPGDPVVEKAVSLLSREHCNARLERVWGPGDGRPVEELKKDIDQLLQEYLLSRELDEAARCVKELDAPHFHHELVKRGVVNAMELDGVKDPEHPEALSNMDAMTALFGFLVRNAIISEYQVKKGIDRLHKVLPDISLDVPAAPKLLEAFEKLAVDQGCLTNKTSSNAVKVVSDDAKAD